MDSFMSDGNKDFCCDEEQVLLLSKQLTLPNQLLGRCPSCKFNFFQIWCDFTCSPRQSDFVQIIETRNDSALLPNKTAYVAEVEYYVKDSYANGLLDSCRNVYTSGTFALNMLCGGADREECTSERLFSFLGTQNRDVGVPFNIRFITTRDHTLTGKQMYPPTSTITRCSEAPYPSTSPCSCQDCPAACSASQPYPKITQEKCEIASVDCMVVLSFAAFAAFCFAVGFFTTVHYALRKDHEADLSDFKPAMAGIADGDLGNVESLGSWIESQLEVMCAHYGELCTRRPLAVFAFGLCVALVCSTGLVLVRFTTDPIELWSSEDSRARREKNFFDANFGPFYRTEQIIVFPHDQSFFPRTDVNDQFLETYYGPALRKNFLMSVLELQTEVERLVAYTKDNTPVTLNDVCFQPMAPANTNCTIMSVLNYFQNDPKNLNKTISDEDSFESYDYLNHLLACAENPYTIKSPLGLSCFSAFGAPVSPFVALGGFNSSNQHHTARGLVITFIINNQLKHTNNIKAQLWEKEFIAYLKNISHPNYTISFMAERSIEDEIERESESDAFTILISYMFMFGYVAFALGQYQVSNNNLATLLIHSKIMLGVAGVLIVALSVTASIGVYAFYGIPATMIVLEVQPFLVLAIGVDNIFIFVQAYQRMDTSLVEPLNVRMSRISGEVIPSMLLSSLSECLCFFLGSLSSMPAVKVFSLYAGLAIFFNFFLQITCFLAIFILDVRREENGRLEVLCCKQYPMEPDQQNNDGFLLHLFCDYFAPFILSKYVRIVVIFTFLSWLCSSLAVVSRLNVGFDQKMAVPENSYVLSHFKAMDRFLSVGPPVYFVVKGELDYNLIFDQNRISSGAGSSPLSLGAQIAHAAKWPERSYIAQPAMNWLDDYLDWLSPKGDPPCCRLFKNGSFCSANENSKECRPCDVVYEKGRPRSDLFYNYLEYFLKDIPGTKCAKGGHAAFASAVRLDTKEKIWVPASYFAAYHTVLKSSSDFINAMASARKLSDSIAKELNQNRKNRCAVEVFPYSVFYPFYEQYVTIKADACVQLILSLIAIFAVATVLLGLDPWSAMIIDITIASTLFNLIGLMHWWDIDFNAVSVVNLVMAAGISVEFCSHIMRAFTISIHRSRLERARIALATMGSSVSILYNVTFSFCFIFFLLLFQKGTEQSFI
ncbi:unnamed protein product [Enterobius vermicularis]|uniref:SSD domain-containing protein n=1 Tax=Enterobius vermicularis TaxID=51028 RepID=A0A0N4V5W7_ENTVE|nr:unnamed protein product [Enterobius vermicularis]